MSAIVRVEGTALPLPGDDVDTDRIVPARFLRAITFEGLGAHAFEDDRAALGGEHPFDRSGSGSAAVLLVNRNFGCGSSREHAPQALRRRGLAAVVGEGFSEIFFGNSVAIGMPCVTVTSAVAEALQAAVEANALVGLAVDLRRGVVSWEGRTAPAVMPAAVRDAFL